MALDHHLKRKPRLVLETPIRSNRSVIRSSEHYIEPQNESWSVSGDITSHKSVCQHLIYEINRPSLTHGGADIASGTRR
jgi:hypothetical protein